MKNKPKPVTVGSVWESKNHGKFMVTEYINSNHVRIVFIDTGYKTKSCSPAIRKGTIKDRLDPSFCGVGFLGDGEHVATMGRRHTYEYQVWCDMIIRCYSKNSASKTPTYKDCYVCDEWHNFQNFAEWHKRESKGGVEKLQIDKDLKLIGNKVYSPETCILVSHQVNSFTTDRRASRNGSLIGASWSKQKGKYASYCNRPFSDKMDYLGYFDSEIAAHMAWRNRKYEYAIMLANQQEREEVKAALLNWAKALKEFRIHPIDN